jgi:hypothetical protein
MSQRRTTVPPTRVSSRSPRSGRSGLIAKDKTEKLSAKRRTALDYRFHRTDLRFTGANRAPGPSLLEYSKAAVRVRCNRLV